MKDEDVHHGYETRASLQKLLSMMDRIDAESPSSVPPSGPANPPFPERVDHDTTTSHATSSASSVFSDHIPGPATSTPTTSTPTTSTPATSTPTTSTPTTSTPTTSPLITGLLTTSPSVRRPTKQMEGQNALLSMPAPHSYPFEVGHTLSPKAAGKQKKAVSVPAGGDDLLGPYVRELSPSNREELGNRANALRREDGTVCPLKMANLFLATSTLRSVAWPDLVDGETAIKKMRTDGHLDAYRAYELQKQEEAENREREKRRLANKRKYGLVRNKEPKGSET
ncbi:hypothetical protein QQS21_012528 [Conoideocrella luteorostrata]|uniref:Uncharacterized protein n=1 Tax=Conoideocrella luteorostrata TaxID=1105319 RepID=A0AAJ0CB07_9HYPO|nr:hypothetical protein QQS21_012528 [Conoideocrella luteorostrata]